MKKYLLLLPVLMLCLCLSSAAAEGRVLRNEHTDLLLPEDAPTYRLIYDYPFVEGDDAAAVLINDSFESARTEMTGLILPMLANLNASENGFLRVMRQEYTVCCNTDRFLSVLFLNTTESENGSVYSMEAHTWDLSGEYIGQTLTLRGVVAVGDSTDEIVDCLYPLLYDEFVRLQEEGTVRSDLTEDDFYTYVFPESDFFTDPDGSVTFFFQPELLAAPSFDVPQFTFTPEELDELLKHSDTEQY